MDTLPQKKTGTAKLGGAKCLTSAQQGTAKLALQTKCLASPPKGRDSRGLALPGKCDLCYSEEEQGHDYSFADKVTRPNNLSLLSTRQNLE